LRDHTVFIVNDASLRSALVGMLTSPTLNKCNALIKEKPPDPSWNKEIFPGILKLEMRKAENADKTQMLTDSIFTALVRKHKHGNKIKPM